MMSQYCRYLLYERSLNDATLLSSTTVGNFKIKQKQQKLILDRTTEVLNNDLLNTGHHHGGFRCVLATVLRVCSADATLLRGNLQ